MIHLTAKNAHIPLFSIIIPTYNSEKTILRCLDSVAQQTLKDFEVIVQDCLSCDDTISCISNFSRKNSTLMIKVFEEADLGVYDAMNKALKHVRGSWVYFLGSDDQLFEATTLESVSKSLIEDVDVIYGDVYSQSVGGRYDGRFSSFKLLHKNICHQSIFIHSSAFHKIGYFNLDYNICADWEHNMRWFLDYSINVIYIDQIIAIFSDGGLSSTSFDHYFDSQKPFIYIYHGRKTLPILTKISLLFNKFLVALRRRNLHDILTVFKMSGYLLSLPIKLER
jgi:glycosyltransferase involved in cell wall biosynthesis